MPPPSRDYERGRDEPYKRLPDEAGGDDFPSAAARETAEACEIEDPEPLVVRTIKAAFDYTAECVLESGVVPDELAKD